MMKEFGTIATVFLGFVGVILASDAECFGQSQNEAAVLAGQGAFLRGAGSYNLNTAQAESIHVDTVIRWKQDLRRIAADYRADKEKQQAGKKQHLEDVNGVSLLKNTNCG